MPWGSVLSSFSRGLRPVQMVQCRSKWRGTSRRAERRLGVGSRTLVGGASETLRKGCDKSFCQCGRGTPSVELDSQKCPQLRIESVQFSPNVFEAVYRTLHTARIECAVLAARHRSARRFCRGHSSGRSTHRPQLASGNRRADTLSGTVTALS